MTFKEIPHFTRPGNYQQADTPQETEVTWHEQSL